MTYLLVGLCVVLAAMLGPSLVWAHSLVNRGDNLRDRLDATQALADEYRHGRDTEVAAHGVTKDELKQEQTLRAIAEAQRNEAMRKARTYLAQNLAHASEKDVDEAIGELFSTPLSLVPGSELERP